MPEEFVFGPDQDGRARWNETIVDFSLQGGDRLFLRNAEASSVEDLYTTKANVFGQDGLSVNYGNGSVFLENLGSEDIAMLIDIAIDFL